MEPFEILVELKGKEEAFLLIPENEETEPHGYRVYDGDTFLGKVWPDINDNGTYWKTDALMAEELLYEIGDKIEKFYS